MGVIRQAKDVPSSLMVLGLPSVGKTRAMIDHLERNNLTSLWVVFTNAGDLPTMHPDWDVAVMADWADFVTFTRSFGRTEDVSKYDVIVVEGVNYAATMALTDLLTAQELRGVNDPRPAYLAMGRDLFGVLAGLRQHFKAMMVTVDVQKDATDENEIALNRDLLSRIVSLFDQKWYAWASLDDKGAVKYGVNKNSTTAYRLEKGN